MNKIPTLFLRDPEHRAHLTRDINPAAAWVLDGDAVPTRKFDGTCVMLDDTGSWWARREVKPGKATPPGYQEIEHDPATGKTMGWEPHRYDPFRTVHHGRPSLPTRRNTCQHRTGPPTRTTRATHRPAHEPRRVDQSTDRQPIDRPREVHRLNITRQVQALANPRRHRVPNPWRRRPTGPRRSRGKSPRRHGPRNPHSARRAAGRRPVDRAVQARRAGPQLA